MHIVQLLYDGEARIWLSERAQKELAKRRKRADRTTAELLRKLQDYAKNGFQKYLNSGTIRSEWGGVWRIGHGRLRLIGFYENDRSMTDFMVIDVFLKRGQELSRTQQKRIAEAAATKKTGQWEKSND